MRVIFDFFFLSLYKVVIIWETELAVLFQKRFWNLFAKVLQGSASNLFLSKPSHIDSE